jgi:S1-C subfamily serine protease
MIGDILVGLAGEPISDHDDLFALLVGEIVGQKTRVQVLRGGELKEVEVTVGERTEQTEKRHRRGRHSRSERHSKRQGGRHHR